MKTTDTQADKQSEQVPQGAIEAAEHEIQNFLSETSGFERGSFVHEYAQAINADLLAALKVAAPEESLKQVREAMGNLLKRSEAATIHEPKCPKWERAVASCGCGLDALHANARAALAAITGGSR